MVVVVLTATFTVALAAPSRSQTTVPPLRHAEHAFEVRRFGVPWRDVRVQGCHTNGWCHAEVCAVWFTIEAGRQLVKPGRWARVLERVTWRTGIWIFRYIDGKITAKHCVSHGTVTDLSNS